MVENKHSGNFWKDTLAGYASGMSYVLSGMPFDIVKVRLQSRKEHSIPTAIKNIYKHEGILAFWSGSLFPILLNSFSGSIIFGVNSLFQRKLRQFKQSDHLSKKELFMSGAGTGIVFSHFLTPVDHMKIKMQVQNKLNVKLYKNSVDCLRKIYQEYGIRGVYKGHFITMFREFVGCGTYFFFYFYFKQKKETGTPLAIMFYGGLTGTLAWNAIFLIDNVKSKIQSDSLANPYYNNIKAFKHLGYRDFTRGYLPGCIRSFPVNAITFLVYETANQILYGRHHY